MLDDKTIDALLKEITPADLEGTLAAEAAELDSEMPGEGMTTDKAWAWTDSAEPDLNSVVNTPEHQESLQQRSAMRKAERANERRRITDEAIKSDAIMLNTPMSVGDKRKLIELYTQPYTDKMKLNEAYIQRIVERALRDAIPTDLVACYKKYPNSVAKFPGFKYKAGKLYGRGLDMWLTPDIPLYFMPEDCQGILEELLMANAKKAIDKSVINFNKHKNARARQEVRLARLLLRCNTFYDLLKENAILYKLIADYYGNKAKDK